MWGKYHEYNVGYSVQRDIMGTSGGYHEYIRGISVHKSDILIHVGDIMSTLGDVSVHQWIS